MHVLWSTYLENVAPLITILHKSTMRKLIETAQDMDNLDKDSKALVLAFCLATVISMSPEECKTHLGETRDTAVQRYRFATEQALAKAGLTDTRSLTLLQAAVLFMIGINGVDGTKRVWTMTATVYRLAQGLGIHIDGTYFHFNPLETEMRRRVWWTICLLDVRSSEDHGTDFQTRSGMYGPRLPLNVNDDDLYPETQTPPKERIGVTDMTFSLIRFEITAAIRKLNHGYSNNRSRPNSSQHQNYVKKIKKMRQHIEDKYIKHCKLDIPLQWVCATVARLCLAKLWLNVYHPMIRTGRGPKLTDEASDSLFLAAIEVIEFGHLIKLDKRTAKWA